MRIRGNEGAGGDSYAFSSWITGNPTGASSFTGLKGKPKSATLIGAGYGNGATRILTNVNPTTGEVNNSEIYATTCSSNGTITDWSIYSGMTFTVTDTSLATSTVPMGVASKQMLVYTY